MKDILVCWLDIPDRVAFFAFPHSEDIIKAHAQFIGGTEHHAYAELVRLMVLKAKEVGSGKPMDLDKYSTLVVCGQVL